MTGLAIPHVLVALCVILAINNVTARPKDTIFPPADENTIENSESIIYPESMNNLPLKMPDDKPKNCFHFFVSRNMSSLLAEATKMLRTIRERREREWILTFIYRIKNLAEHLRSHPESRNYDCLPNGDESRKRILSNDVKGQQPELYFVDDVLKRSNEGEIQQEKGGESLVTNKQEAEDLVLAKDSPSSSPAPHIENAAEVSASSVDSSGPEPVEEHKDISVTKKQDVLVKSGESTQTSKDLSSSIRQPPDGSIILSSTPDCDSTAECQRNSLSPSPENLPEKYYADSGDIYPEVDQEEIARRQDIIAELYEQELLKERIRKALLEELAPEIKKLRTVGGTAEDLMTLWNSNIVQEDKSVEDREADFDYEETGAAAGDLNMNEKIQPDRTVAPSLDEVQSSKENSNSGKDSSYEPYDDSDVLVQQLFDVRFNDPPSKTTKSLSDQSNEYLITSTHAPF